MDLRPLSHASPISPEPRPRTLFGVEGIPWWIPVAARFALDRLHGILIGRNALPWGTIAPTPTALDFSALDVEMDGYAYGETKPRVVLTLLPRSPWGCADSVYDSPIHWSPVVEVEAWRDFVATLCERYHGVLAALVVGEEPATHAQSGGEQEFAALISAAFEANETAVPVVYGGLNVGPTFDLGIPDPIRVPIWTLGGFDEYAIHANRSFGGIAPLVAHLRSLGVECPIMADDAGSVNGLKAHEHGWPTLDAEDLEVAGFTADEEYRAHQPGHVDLVAACAERARLSRVLFTGVFDAPSSPHNQNRLGGMLNPDGSDRPAMTLLRQRIGGARKPSSSAR